MKRIFADCWTGLRTGPARAGLAFLSLALGLFAVPVLLATFSGLQRRARVLVEEFGAGTFVLLPSDGEGDGALWSRRVGEILRRNLKPEGTVSGIRVARRSEEDGIAVIRTDAQISRVLGWRMTQGRPLDEQDVRQGSRCAMVPESLCRRKGWRLGEILSVEDEPVRLVGIYEGGAQVAATVPQEAVWIPHTALHLERGDVDNLARVETWIFRAADGVKPDRLRERAEVLLAHPELQAVAVEWVTPESLLEGIRRWQRTIAWSAGTGGLLGLVLGAVTLAGMLLTGVRERIPEIGLRRALGARRHEVAALFILEALLLTGAAAILGAALAEGAVHALGSRFPLPFHFGIAVRLLPLALAVGLAVLCSLGPAWLAAHQDPAEALRNE